MPTAPLISVIVPVYNVAPFLSRCLDSLLAQTYPHLEIILVDDGSTDNSLSVCQAYAQKDSRICVVHQANAGVSAARNVGLDKMHGEFFSFVDGDDWLDPSFYKTLVTLQQKTQAEMTWCNVYYVPEKGPRQMGLRLAQATQKNLSLEDFLCASIQKEDFFVWNKIYDSKCLGALRFDTRYRVGEDWLFVTRFAAQAQRIICTDIPLYFYYQRASSAVCNTDSQVRYPVVTLWENLYALCQKNGFTRALGPVRDGLVSFTSVFVMAAGVDKNATPAQWKQAYHILHTHRKYLFKTTLMGRPGKVFAWLFVTAPRLTRWGVGLPGISWMLRRLFVKRIARCTKIAVREPAYATPRKVLLFNDVFLQAGGIETLLANWYDQVDREKISFDFAILSNRNLNQTFAQKVLTNGDTFLCSQGQDWNLLARLKFYIKLYQLIRRKQYDVFCYNSFPLLLFPCLLAKCAGAKKVVILCHGTGVLAPTYWQKLKKQISGWCIRMFTDVQGVVSHKVGQAFFGTRTFTVLYQGIDTKRFSFAATVREQVRRELGLSGQFVLGTVGRIVEDKNPSFILNLFKQVVAQNPAARLVWVGSGPLAQSVREQTQKMGMGEQVIFTGARPDTPRYYNAFDAFVLPSFCEGLPLVWLEAQASGLPCFVSDAVTTEANVCNSTVIPLEKEPDYWAEVILTQTKNFKRKDASMHVQQAGFDKKEAAQRMEDFFLSL